jgi:hypothetical protein
MFKNKQWLEDFRDYSFLIKNTISLGIDLERSATLYVFIKIIELNNIQPTKKLDRKMFWKKNIIFVIEKKEHLTNPLIDVRHSNWYELA